MAESNTFKYLGASQSTNAAKDFLQEKLSKNKYTQGDPYAYGEGVTPGGEAYPDTIVPGTEKEVFTPNSRDYASDVWQHHVAGATHFEDNWNSSKFAQQIKASGPVNSEYDEKFAALKKSDSKVDDGEGWMTLKSRRNDEAGTKEEFEALAKEWKEAGYDVRVHDLDNSSGAKWADIAVRKGPGGETKVTGETKPPEPIEHSPEIKQAKERVKTYEQDVMSGKTSQEIFGKGEQLATDKYIFDASKGAAGIGTTAFSASQQGAADATQSFLDNKVSQVKKTLSPIN